MRIGRLRNWHKTTKQTPTHRSMMAMAHPSNRKAPKANDHHIPKTKRPRVPRRMAISTPSRRVSVGDFRFLSRRRNYLHTLKREAGCPRFRATYQRSRRSMGSRRRKARRLNFDPCRKVPRHRMRLWFSLVPSCCGTLIHAIPHRKGSHAA